MPAHDPSRHPSGTSPPYRERTSRALSRNSGRPSRTASDPGWRASSARRASFSREAGARPAEATRSRCCASRERSDRTADLAPRAPTPNATATSPTSRGVRAREKAEVTSSSFSVQVEAMSHIVGGAGGTVARRGSRLRGGFRTEPSQCRRLGTGSQALGGGRARSRAQNHGALSVLRAARETRALQPPPSAPASMRAPPPSSDRSASSSPKWAGASRAGIHVEWELLPSTARSTG